MTHAGRGICALLVSPLVVTLAACPASHETACVAGDACVVAGTGEAGDGGDGGPAHLAELWFPTDVTVGPDGRLYVVDWNNNRVRVIREDGTIAIAVGSGALGEVRAGAASVTDMNHPTEVVFDRDGRMLIATWFNSVVARVDLARDTLEVVAGNGERAYHGDGGRALDAAFDRPVSLAFDGGGALLVADQSNHVIRRIDGSGVIRTVAGTCTTATCAPGEAAIDCADSDKQSCASDPEGCNRPCEGGHAGDGGPAAAARFHFPWGAVSEPGGRIAAGRDAEIYVADTHNHRVRRIDADGIVTTVAGTGRRGTDGDDGRATDASLEQPTDVAVGPDGTLFIADSEAGCVRAVGLDGRIRTVVGRCGERGVSPDHAPARETLLDRPHGIDVAPDGTLFVADTANHRVLRIEP